MLSEAAFGKDLEKVFAEFFTPAAQTVSAPEALLAHEFGHLMDRAAKGSWQGSNSLLLEQHPAGSEYGRRCGVRETFAEAFAEYDISKGTTGDPLARALAREEGWNSG